MPKWVSASKVPKRSYHPVWVETTSFEEALRAFGARAFKTHLPDGVERSFCLSLSSGRCAILSCHENFPQSVQFNLEVSRGGDRSIGSVYAADMIEILLPLGLSFRTPTQLTEPRWR